MILRTYLSFLLLLACFHVSVSQMVVGQDTLVGNEWIRYDQTYYKFIVEKDGVYRITGAALVTAGVPTAALIGSDLRIYNFGKQIPLYASTDGPFGPADYVA